MLPTCSTTKRRFDTHGKIKGPERVLVRQFAFPRTFVGKLIEIRRGMIHAHRQRAEIVQRGNFDLTGGHRFENAGHQADARAVAQLRIFEAQVANLAQHGPAIRVPMGIPTGREGEHGVRLNGIATGSYLTCLTI